MCPYCNTNAEMIPVSTVWWIIGAVVMATFIVSWFLFHHLWFKKKSYPMERPEHAGTAWES